MAPPPVQPGYTTSLEELVWGGLLVGVTMVMHGIAMIGIMQLYNRLKPSLEKSQSILRGIGVLILSSWLIVLSHLVEVMVWAGFFLGFGAMPNRSVSFYFSLMEYTTVGSNYNLPLRWRLLEGLLATAGLLTFAWSTAVLLTLAQEFQDREVSYLEHRRERKKKLRSGETTPS
jgi:voltage-gated potassium channel